MEEAFREALSRLNKKLLEGEISREEIIEFLNLKQKEISELIVRNNKIAQHLISPPSKP